MREREFIEDGLITKREISCLQENQSHQYHDIIRQLNYECCYIACRYGTLYVDVIDDDDDYDNCCCD